MSEVVFLKINKVSKDEVRKTVHRAMDLGKWKKFVKGKKIFVKINGISDQLVPGQCTSPWVVDSVLEKLRKAYPKADIYMGDADLAASRQLNDAARIWGFKDLAKKYNVKFVNLSEQPLIETEFGGKVLKRTMVPRILLDVDVILNIPVAKSHCLTTITCCLKNHWGMLPRFRHQFHMKANQAIPDVNNFFRKTVFNVVDMTVCMEGNAPRTGIPKVCNVIMAGSDRVAIDYTAARYMGFNANVIKHISNAEKMGIGSRKNIKIVGDEFYVNKFVPPEANKQPIFFWEMSLRKIPVAKQIFFDTPLFKCCCELSKYYNASFWYNRQGKGYIKDVMETDYSAEYGPLLKKSRIKI